ncbi:endonuclease [Marinifilum sp. D714]|uniref:endonuclease n=1 Tax=Marinifilum sp. D714 TaxID=2937523 RepID=UPI0027BCB839|nr:endonuclease [Marinifilum sp. D714]MDQ2179563.1 endonuclease [Marinifilum sp. D714]
MTKLLRTKTLFILNALLLWSSILFAQVSVEEYYQSATGKTGSELKTTLHNIIKGHTELPYTSSEFDVWDALDQADQDPDNENNVILIYTGRSIPKAEKSKNNEADYWNREHIWAKSHGDFGTNEGPGTDIHALRPCDASVNSDRSNRFFDNGGTVHDEATDCKFDNEDFTWEPRNAVKGDIARMIFYMAVRYDGEDGHPDLKMTDDLSYSTITDKTPVFGKLSVLKQWHEQDPVDEAELARNEKVYEIQGNRNPFIDHPEWVEEVWTTVVDTDSPIVTELSPAKGAVGVSPTANLIIKFNEEIKEGTGSVTIKRYNTETVFETLTIPSARLQYSGNQLLINSKATYEEGVKYYVLIDNGAITDASSNTFDGISNKDYWTFTAAYTAPKLVDFSPADNSNGVAIDTNLELTFDKDVQAGEGNITVYDDSGVFESISTSSSDVTFNGKIATVDLPNDLEGATEYYVLIDNNAFISTNNVAYEGISDDTYWTFTTEVITGIDDLYAKGVPSFYPNPATREIKLTNIEKVVSISITNLTGRNIMEVKSPDTSIPIGNLPKGMYFVTFISNDGSRITKKLLKR